MAVRAGVDAQHDARRNVIILVNERLTVRARSEIAVAEGTEGRQLLAVVGLAEFFTYRCCNKAQAEQPLAEATGDRILIAQIERRFGISLHPLLLQRLTERLAGR